MKQLLLALLLLLSFSSHSGEKVYNKQSRIKVERTAAVKILFNDRLVTVGSAWAYKDIYGYHIVSAYHIIEGTTVDYFFICAALNEYDCLIVDRDDAIVQLGLDASNDWARWNVDVLPTKLKVSEISYDFEIGEKVWASGAPLGRIGEITQGIITNFYNEWIYTDNRIAPGMSGGPVFNQDNKVIGMIIAFELYPGLGAGFTTSIVLPVSKIIY